MATNYRWNTQDYLLLHMEEELIELEEAWIRNNVEEYIRTFQKVTVYKNGNEIISVVLRKRVGDHNIMIDTGIRKIYGTGVEGTESELDDAAGRVKGDMCAAINQVYR